MTELPIRYPAGIRIVILNVDGMIYHGLPIKTGHSEHVGKHGTLAKWDDDIPLLRLDDGSEVEGCECWWLTEQEWGQMEEI